jgi:EmrB/QacA subfamily drug resistance transporter
VPASRISGVREEKWRTVEANSQLAHERRWWTLGVLCLSLTVISIDNTILNVALPSIVEGLGAGGSELQLLIDGYTIVFACLLLTAGSLGDKLGRKGILTVGLGLFGAFSALAAFSTSATMLIVARGLMGIGGACIYPSTLSILTNTFHDERERARAIGIWAGVSGLGVAIGPLAGGLLVEHFWWGSVFLVNVPICAIAIVAGHVLVPTTTRDPDHALDPWGAVLSIVALMGLLYAIIEVPDRGAGDPVVVVSFLVGLVFLAAFAWWETHYAHPMLDLRFFQNPRFSAASATITLTFFALYGSTFLLTQYFQFVLQYSPFKAGLLTAPVAVGIMVMAPQAPKLVERVGTKLVVVAGLSTVGTGLLLYSVEPVMSSLVGGALVRLLFGLGMGCVMAPATESIMGSLPKAKAGVGSAVNDTTRQAGGALGVAVIGSVFAATYHHVIEVPAGLPARAVPMVHDSIGSALEAVTRFSLPSDLAVAVHDAASSAFFRGMQVAAWAGAAVMVCAVVVAYKYLPARSERATRADDELADDSRLAASLDDGMLT